MCNEFEFDPDVVPALVLRDNCLLWREEEGVVKGIVAAEYKEHETLKFNFYPLSKW